MNDEIDISKKIENFSLKLKTSQALNYLYSGNYKIADTILLEVISVYGETPDLLNLYAISLVQQGNFTEADTVLHKALKYQPENLHFQKAIKKLNILKKKRFFFSFKINFGLKVVLFLLIIISFCWGSISLISLLNSNKIINNKQNSTISFNKQDNLQLIGILDKISKVDTGIIISSKDSNATITFNDGLFYKGLLLKNKSKKLITKLEEVLTGNNVKIIIYGCTDDIPMPSNKTYSDNISLAYKRAQIIGDLIRYNGKVPSENILISAYPASLSPYSNKTYIEKLKNRTVIIKIVPES